MSKEASRAPEDTYLPTLPRFEIPSDFVVMTLPCTSSVLAIWRRFVCVFWGNVGCIGQSPLQCNQGLQKFLQFRNALSNDDNDDDDAEDDDDEVYELTT